MALQNELTGQENIALVREFVKTQLVDEGMICDFAVHSPDKNDGIPNPHAHVMATMRPLNPDGTFGQKQRRKYVTDEYGNSRRDTPEKPRNLKRFTGTSNDLTKSREMRAIGEGGATSSVRGFTPALRRAAAGFRDGLL